MQNRNEVIDLRSYRVGENDAVDATEQSDPQYLPAGTTLLLGQYEVTGYLNSGGFGVTYRAHDSLGREVVVKECFPGEMCFRSGKKMRARTPKYKDELDAIVQHFVKEAHRLASVRHANVVHVHQVFEENDTAYMTMDYIAGPDLLDIVEYEPKRFSPEDIEKLVQKMLHAIKYVHDCGMLHRDISPDNIIVDDNGEPILIDFGAAREYVTKNQRAYSKLKFVKDGYSPQEFYIAGSEQGTWSDLYSFAASIYHLMTGAAPEDAQKRLAAIAAKKPDPYVPLERNVSGYPMRFLKALDKALNVLPDQRIQTADEWLGLVDGAAKAEEGATPVPGVLDKMPALEDMVSSSTAAHLAVNHKRAIAAGVTGAALLVGAGLYGYQATFSAIEDAPTAALPSPVIAADPRMALVDPVAGGLPQGALVALSLGDVTGKVAALRPATPPSQTTAPILQARPEIGSVQALSTPFVGIDGPDVPEAAAPPARVASIGPIGLVELVSAPQMWMPVPTLDAFPAVSEEVDVPGALAARPDISVAATLQAPTPEAAPVVEAQSLPVAISLDALGVSFQGFAPTLTENVGITLASAAGIGRVVQPSELTPALSETKFWGDVTPPAAFEPIGTLSATQIAYAHWDVRMPFEAELLRVRNANTAQITKVADDADMAIAGDWIAEGVIVYSFNGERLEEDTPLSVHILQSLNIDPDGYARATVRYRNPASGTLDRGLLSVPVVREIGLADGSIVQARMVDLNWVLEVTATASDGLNVGDILTGEAGTGIAFSTPEALVKALDELAAREIETAKINVLRNGQPQLAEWKLARDLPPVRE